MRLVITSDCHGYLERAELPPGDILVLGGDLFANHSPDPDRDAAFQLNDLLQLDEFCNGLDYGRILMIAGNHDWIFERDRSASRRLKNITYLEDSSIVIEGVKFYGSPHQPEFFDWAFNLPRGGAELARYWSLIPDDTDVLITHGPPFGILDRPFGKRPPAGCELLAKRVQEVRPKVHAFGHIHGGYGRQQVGPTLFLNASLCDETYEPVNPPHVVDLEL